MPARRGRVAAPLAQIPANLNCHCEAPAGRRGNLGPESLRRREIAARSLPSGRPLAEPVGSQ